MTVKISRNMFTILIKNENHAGFYLDDIIGLPANQFSSI